MILLTDYSYKKGSRNLIYPIYEDRRIDAELTNLLGFDLNDEIDKSLGTLTSVHTLGKLPFSKIMFLGLGASAEMTTRSMRKALGALSEKIKDSMDFALPFAATEVMDESAIAAIYAETYQMSQYEEQIQGHDAKVIPEQYVISDAQINSQINIQIEEALTTGEIIGKAVNYEKILADTPANLMTPSILVQKAQELAARYHMDCTILDMDKLTEMKAGGILAVNLGSDEPCAIICIKYQGNGNAPFKAYIGKGLTFDSGGYNIKSNSYGMKYDMIGGASVLAVMEILAVTKARTNVYGIVPTTENMISGHGYRPQDVITTLSGKTVEIVSTDAEGRMILCDAITYAQTLDVTHIIDMATLTGACARALGTTYTGIFSNDDDFCAEFQDAANRVDEKVWRLPMDQEYRDMLKSNSADMKNSAGKPLGGASVAANFLQEFVNEGVKWVHVDVAGTGEVDGHATGVMVRTVAEVLK